MAGGVGGGAFNTPASTKKNETLHAHMLGQRSRSSRDDDAKGCVQGPAINGNVRSRTQSVVSTISFYRQAGGIEKKHTHTR